ncbi:MAG: DNA repair protein RecN [Nitrospiraceae bacterium]|nr:DNA repair protein RecN [Nitrospiraceae bacterium]
MLRELRIRNFAIIGELPVQFDRGLTVLTGETGAGKSIIVDALGVALGGRAYSEMIKTGSDSAVVEVFFECGPHPLLDRLGIEQDGGIIFRRIISSASGKNRAYINNTLVSAQTLSEAGKDLVDIHGQHEHQGLLSPQNQLLILDQSAGIQLEKERFSAFFGEVKAIEERLEALKESLRERARTRDLLSFQAEEILAAELSPGEEEKLAAEKKMLCGMARLKELAESVYMLLYGSEGAVSEGLSKARAALGEMASIDMNAREPLQMLESASPLIEEAVRYVRSAREDYELDPERLNHVEERLELIGKLRKKYGASIEEILGFLENAQAELKKLDSIEEDSAALEKEFSQKKAKLLDAALALSKKREKAAAEAEKAVTSILKGLALENAEFRIELARAEQPGPDGMDRTEFLFNANPGEGLKPLAKVASGGELSRLMLAIKSAMRGQDVPVLIFDEVDAGIGGKAAVNVAARLRELAKTHQVLCISHLPQIASAGDNHLLVEKTLAKNGTSVSIRRLAAGEREEEIARMLGGKITGASIKHARELIERGTSQ